MEQHHGAPEDGMGSEAEGGATAAGLVMTASNIADVGQSHVPAVGASEAKGISSSIAEKMANLGTSSGSALKIRKKCIH
jgi:hypothetical protein